jgi:demethoxyubiquinone hydroxylase (CLK1/Coq7/Cat5 family)
MGISLLALMFASCAPQAPMDEETPAPTQPPMEYTPAERAAITALSETLSLPAEQITLISTEAVTWPDGCLGVHRAGVMCTQALVPGYRMILEADGKQYELRTNESGSQVVIADGLETIGLMEKAIIAQLAGNLGLDESDISVVSNTEVEFGDACLGVHMQGELCAQAITPGHIIVLEAKGVQYEYHISADGSRVQPATFALIWTREGGIAGFCDNVTVFLSGEVYGGSCMGGGTMESLINLLTSDEIAQLDEWISQYGQIDIDASDPEGVSDRMVVTLTLFGNGSRRTISTATQRNMLEFAQSLHQRMDK